MRRGASYWCALDLLIDQSGATAGGFSSIATINLGGADSKRGGGKNLLEMDSEREREGRIRRQQGQISLSEFSLKAEET